MADVTQILSQMESGDRTAANRLLVLVYDELRRLAASRLAQERPGQTLQATALVHEVWLKLVGADQRACFENRRHFFSAAAEAMQRILIDQARRRMTARHGGDWQKLPELPDVADPGRDPEQALMLNELLERLAARYSRQASVARMHLYLQMNFPEIAEVIGMSTDTAETDWAFARAWLKRELSSS